MANPADDLIPTRATLIQRLKNWQDQASWQDFFDTYWRLILGVAIKSGLNQTEAEDVVQETMFSVAKRMPHFQYDPAIGSFKSWLLNLVRWRITDQLRKRGPLVTHHFHPDHGVGSEDTHPMADPASQALERMWEEEWEKNLCDAAIAAVKRRLDPQRYQIFDLYVNKGWPPEKVAQTFNIPIDQVYLAKHRVTEMIKREVKRLEQEMT
jgi:RNA polymerase sigma-70 factor (ECF subfamily)